MKSYLIRKYNLAQFFFHKRIIQNLIVILGAVVLLTVLGKSIANADTVWELADEAGYLSNVAYFLGYDWGDVRATMPYYAYGYSVFLIPIYLITNTGVQLIRGAMCINLLFAIGTYFILIYLLEKVGKQENRILTSAISFIACLNSYLCCNVLKVDCESLSVFWYCLTALTLYKTMTVKKKYWFAILGVIVSFLFFIHTRMIVLILTLILTLVITLLLYDKRNIVQLIWFTIAFSLCFMGLYFIKHMIVSYAAALGDTSGVTQGNLVDSNYILDRIRGFFNPENLELYILSFLSKIYYIIIVSAGTILFGFVYLCRSLLAGQSRNEDSSSYAVKLFFLLGMIMMVIVCTLNGAGRADNFCYFFYSRYYENTVIPMIAFSILGLVTIKWKDKDYFIFLMLIITIGVVITILKKYLDSDNIWMDTARIPGLSWLIKNTDTFYHMILWGIAINVLIISIYYLGNKFRPRIYIILFLILVITWESTSLGINIINEVHANAEPDAEIADYILNSGDCDFVYMIDDESFTHLRYYSRMQVLLKDIPIKVIYNNELERIDEIPDGTWVLTYTTTTLRDTYLVEFNSVMIGKVFEVWRK